MDKSIRLRKCSVKRRVQRENRKDGIIISALSLFPIPLFPVPELLLCVHKARLQGELSEVLVVRAEVVVVFTVLLFVTLYLEPLHFRVLLINHDRSRSTEEPFGL